MGATAVASPNLILFISWEQEHYLWWQVLIAMASMEPFKGSDHDPTSETPTHALQLTRTPITLRET